MAQDRRRQVVDPLGIGDRVDLGDQAVDGLRVANVYLVTTDDALLLVDSEVPGSGRRIVAFMERRGRAPRDLRWLVLTHCDLDHVGSAAELQRLTGAEVLIHELDARVLAGGRPQKGGLAMRALYGLLRFRPVVADRELHDGDAVAGLTVIHAPGHTAGSVALRRDDGVLFSGDALLSDRRGRVQPPDRRLALDPAEAATSAQKLAALGFRLLLAGHGQPAAR